MTAIRHIIENENYRNVLSVIMWSLSFKEEAAKKSYLSNLLSDFLSNTYQIPKKNNSAILFIRSLERNDYSELSDTIIKSCGEKNIEVASIYQKKAINFNKDAYLFLKKHLDLLDQLEIKSDLDRQCCFVLLMTYGFILENYKNVKAKALVCFSDMQPIESLFSIYFKSRGIKTVTLQHGLYVYYKDYKTINSINYLSQSSDYFLSWGRNTSTLIKHSNPEAEIFICGKPNIRKTKENQLTGNKTTLVVLDQPIFRKQNFELIEIAFNISKRIESDIFFKFHPGINGDEKNLYFKKYPKIKEQEDINKPEYILGHTSTLIFEALALGKKVFQYQTNIPSIQIDESLKFKCADSLLFAINNYKNKNYSEDYFSFIGEDSKSRYKIFFDWLLNKKTNQMPIKHREKLKYNKTINKPAWLSKMEEDFYSCTNKIGCVAIPCIRGDIESLAFNLEAWVDPRLTPRVQPEKHTKPQLLIVFNNIDSHEMKQAESIWSKIPRLSIYFKGLTVKNAELHEDYDLYVKNRDETKKGEFGNIAGPNFLFQKTMNYAKKWGGYTLQLELDCFPLLKDWITLTEKIIDKNKGSWVIGSNYLGDFRINNRTKTHLNGNALYKTGDSNFISFLNKTWMPRLLSFSNTLPNLAYDTWWAIETDNADTRLINEDSSWSTYQRYSSFFSPEPFILNFLKNDNALEKTSYYFKFFSDLGKSPIFIHWQEANKYAKEFLKSDKKYFLEYLQPALKNNNKYYKNEEKKMLLFDLIESTELKEKRHSNNTKDNDLAFILDSSEKVLSGTASPELHKIFLLAIASHILANKNIDDINKVIRNNIYAIKISSASIDDQLFTHHIKKVLHIINIYL